MNFSKTLVQWYLQNKRDLPWRNNTNPYTIWLSEIMLQQTRVAQGLPYFLRFTEAFPTVFELANASQGRPMDRPIPANAVDVFLIKSLRDDAMVVGFSKIY